MAPDAQFFSEGINKMAKNDKFPLKINSTIRKTGKKLHQPQPPAC